MIQNKEHYSPPRVKVVSFFVEEGYQASTGLLGQGMIERLSNGNTYDGSLFGSGIGGNSPLGGGVEGLTGSGTYGESAFGPSGSSSGGSGVEGLSYGSEYTF
ncbi:MAG: hypothetical protein MJZ45_03925 [Bacteroidales bacterium]|nr:hypothetical protein [Bacteroidales bacterium]